MARLCSSVRKMRLFVDGADGFEVGNPKDNVENAEKIF